MTAAYAAAVDQLRWLMDALEARLGSLPDGAAVDAETARCACPSRRATADEATAALDALAELGVLARAPGGRVLDRSALAATASYRAGVRAGLAVQRPDGPLVGLCAALPPGLAGAVEAALRRCTQDLRGAVVDLVAGARKDLVLVSPFWDAATLDEIGPVVTHRLAAGVCVRLLGRFEAGASADARDALARLASHPGCRLLSWYEPSGDDPFGTRTFHFKAAVADGGVRAYLGTANFTTSGLRSRLELRVVLEGETAWRLAEIVEAVLALARPAAVGVAS